MRIELTCAECHKNSFNLGHGVEDDSVIRCISCGHEIGTMAELKKWVAAEVLKHAANERPLRPSSLAR
jgi:DNA-directed RNA polymerase subunit RPC12/RpoP